ncbi:protein LAZ1 [Tanacetum coccineum]
MGDDRYAVSNGGGYAVLISWDEYVVLDRELDTPYPMEVDTPYSTCRPEQCKRCERLSRFSQNYLDLRSSIRRLEQLSKLLVVPLYLELLGMNQRAKTLDGITASVRRCNYTFKPLKLSICVAQNEENVSEFFSGESVVTIIVDALLQRCLPLARHSPVVNHDEILWQGVATAILCSFRLVSSTIAQQLEFKSSIQDFIICIEIGIASMVHLYVFLSEPYKLMGDIFVGDFSVLGDYSSDCPLDPDEVMDSKRSTKLRLPQLDYDVKNKTTIRDSVHDVFIGGKEYESFLNIFWYVKFALLKNEPCYF